MTLQLGALRDALLEAGASAVKANKAAEELADYEQRLAAIDVHLTRIDTRLDGFERRFTLLTWAVGINAAATIAVFGMLVSMAQRLGEIAQLLHHG